MIVIKPFLLLPIQQAYIDQVLVNWTPSQNQPSAFLKFHCRRRNWHDSILKAKLSLISKVIWSLHLVHESNILNADTKFATSVAPWLISDSHPSFHRCVVEDYGLGGLATT